MAEISVKVIGELTGLRTLGARVDAAVMDALDECAALVANDAKSGHPKLNYISQKGVGYAGVGRGAGRMAADDAYRVANLDGSLRFLTRTGVTRNSILPKRAKKTSNGLEARVVSGQAHSEALEYGTVNRRPFPFMRPALDNNHREIQRRIANGVRRGVEGK